MLFHGLKSEGPKETASQTAALVTKFFNENLTMDCEFVNKIEVAHAHRLPKRSAGSNEKVLYSNNNMSSSPIVVKFVKMNDKKTMLRRAVDAKKFNVVALLNICRWQCKQQRRDLFRIAKTFHSKGKGKKITWRIIGSDYYLFIDGNRYIPKQKLLLN